jgi:hypothetical protein
LKPQHYQERKEKKKKGNHTFLTAHQAAKVSVLAQLTVHHLMKIQKGL